MSNLTTVSPTPYEARIEKVRQKKIVFMVDEAHRSTFGKMLRNIKLTYPRALFFGFTGTPIMDVNAVDGITTDGLFGSPLHQYTIAEGIRDKNVLGFSPSKVMTFEQEDLRTRIALLHMGKARAEELTEEEFAKFHELASRDMSAIEADIESSLYSDGRSGALHRQNVVKDLLSKWERISFRGKFHYILATSSILEAVEYYRLLKDNDLGLFVTALFDPNTDNDAQDIFKEKGVEEILSDYNRHFNLKFTAGNYRRFKDDVCSRLAHREPYQNIDANRAEAVNIVIVVNQLLTGFDSKWINTLYLDKVLEYDELIQAISRTNRLNGPEKPYGIVKFCRKPFTMERNTENALRLYANREYRTVFIPSLGQNILEMNQTYEGICTLFDKNGIRHFSELPKSQNDIRLFTDLFNRLSRSYYRAIPQLFTWSRKTYLTEDAGEVTVMFDEPTYQTLHQRYSEIPKTLSSDDIIYDIIPSLTEISSAEIDLAFMESKFAEVMKNLSEGIKMEEIKPLFDDLRANFSILPSEDQIIAEAILEDLYSGAITDFDGQKSLSEYIERYKRDLLKERIGKFSAAFGFDTDKLARIMALHLTEDTLLQAGLFDQTMSTVDFGRAKDTIERLEGGPIKPHRVILKAEAYLKKFILSGGELELP